MINATYQPADRRPLASRDLEVVHRVAAWLVVHGVSRRYHVAVRVGDPS